MSIFAHISVCFILFFTFTTTRLRLRKTTKNIVYEYVLPFKSSFSSPLTHPQSLIFQGRRGKGEGKRSITSLLLNGYHHRLQQQPASNYHQPATPTTTTTDKKNTNQPASLSVRQSLMFTNLSFHNSLSLRADVWQIKMEKNSSWRITECSLSLSYTARLEKRAVHAFNHTWADGTDRCESAERARVSEPSRESELKSIKPPGIDLWLLILSSFVWAACGGIFIIAHFLYLFYLAVSCSPAPSSRAEKRNPFKEATETRRHLSPPRLASSLPVFAFPARGPTCLPSPWCFPAFSSFSFSPSAFPRWPQQQPQRKMCPRSTGTVQPLFSDLFFFVWFSLVCGGKLFIIVREGKTFWWWWYFHFSGEKDFFVFLCLFRYFVWHTGSRASHAAVHWSNFVWVRCDKKGD